MSANHNSIAIEQSSLDAGQLELKAADERRRDIIDGLRQAADLLEADEGERFLPVHPYTQWTLSLLSSSYDAATLADAARALGTVAKHAYGDWFDVRRALTPAVVLEVAAPRENVCTQVTRTQEIERTVPVDDQEASRIAKEMERLQADLEALPTRTETVTEEITEWECPDSLLRRGPSTLEEIREAVAADPPVTPEEDEAWGERGDA